MNNKPFSTLVTRRPLGFEKLNLNSIAIMLILIFCSKSIAQPAPATIRDFPILAIENFESVPVAPEVAQLVLDVYLRAANEMNWDEVDNVSVVSTRTYAIPRDVAMQVILKKYDLGDNSFLFIATEDQGVFQRMSQSDLENYSGKSAFFPGGKLLISVLKVGDDAAPTIRLDKLRLITDRQADVMQIESPDSLDALRKAVDTEDAQARRLAQEPQTLCGDDERRRDTDKRIGRLMPIGCTGWLIQNDLALSAGHCAGNIMDIIEFQVPDSTINGRTRPAAVSDQYPIIKATMKSEDAGPGNDWVVFEIGPNSNTGKLPGQVQGSFFSLSQSQRPKKGIVIGYGEDNKPRGPAGRNNKDSQTQQMENGNGNAKIKFFSNGGDSYFRYRIDTMGGNSGSPLIDEEHANGAAIAIHTHGGCGPGTDGNHGTSASNADLRAAIKHFVNDLARVYVD